MDTSISQRRRLEREATQGQALTTLTSSAGIVSPQPSCPLTASDLHRACMSISMFPAMAISLLAVVVQRQTCWLISATRVQPDFAAGAGYIFELVRAARGLVEAGPSAGPSASKEALSKLEEMSLLCRSIRTEIKGEGQQHSQRMHAQLASLYPCCPQSYWDWHWIVYESLCDPNIRDLASNFPIPPAERGLEGLLPAESAGIQLS